MKTCEYLSSVSRVPESNSLGFLVLVAVCGTSSRLTQVTFAPTGTVSFCGLNVKLSIVI